MIDGPDYVAGLNALAAIEEPTPAWRVFADDGFTGGVTGTGTIFGTSGAQDVNVGAFGDIKFDPSFSRGGDTIRFWGTAEVWTIEQEGSNAVLTRVGSESVSVTIPVGTAGTKLVFGIGYTDDETVLRFDPGTAKMMIGSEDVTSAPSVLESGLNLPTSKTVDLSGSARMFLPEGDWHEHIDMQFAVSGDFKIFGAGDSRYKFNLDQGSFALDPSFNRGGHEIEIFTMNDLTATSAGSNVVLSDARTQVVIPVGLEGSYIGLGYTGGTIRYDVDQKAIVYEKTNRVEVIDERGIKIYSDWS